MVIAAQPYGEPATTLRPAQRRAVAGLWSCGPRPATELKCIAVRFRRQQSQLFAVAYGEAAPSAPAHFTGGCRLPPSKPAARNI